MAAWRASRQVKTHKEATCRNAVQKGLRFELDKDGAPSCLVHGQMLEHAGSTANRPCFEALIRVFYLYLNLQDFVIRAFWVLFVWV